MHRIEYKYAQIYLICMIFDTFCSWETPVWGKKKDSPKYISVLCTELNINMHVFIIYILYI